MRIVLTDENKITQFISILSSLKNFNSIIKCVFYDDYLHIQGLDKSLVSLYEIRLCKEWFNTYDVIMNQIISLDINILINILNIYQNSQIIIFNYDLINDADKLNIDFINNSEVNEKNKVKTINKSFEVPLIELDDECLEIPKTDYKINFSFNSKSIFDLINQLSTFGEELIISCDEENINFTSLSCEKGKMKSTVSFDELYEYDVDVEEEVEITFSILYIKKCLNVKILNNINFCLSENFPLKINYDLGDNSYANFYLAPKIKNE